MNKNLITIENPDRIRSYANILSKSTIETMVRKSDCSYIRKKFNKYDKDYNYASNPTFDEYFRYVFYSLKSNYRNEYIYKNTIINDLLIAKYGLDTTTALNEFKTNKSIADLVLLNGSSKVFEIKTELDTPSRLESQINDYKKVFEEIYIVTFLSLTEKYIKLIDKEIGILSLSEDLKLSTIREANKNSNFDNIAILKCLRKPEYINVLERYFGFIPKTTDFKFYQACKELFLKIPSKKLHDLMLVELKKRKIKEEKLLTAKSTPEYLKYICYTLDLDQNEYKKLSNILNRKI